MFMKRRVGDQCRGDNIANIANIAKGCGIGDVVTLGVFTTRFQAYTG